MEHVYEEHHPDSPVLQCVWQARATRDERYLVPAVEYWDMWFARSRGGEILAGLSGPRWATAGSARPSGSTAGAFS